MLHFIIFYLKKNKYFIINNYVYKFISDINVFDYDT